MSTKVRRYHDISCGHRVVGHESKCRHLHGHNYRVHFVCQGAELDEVGRVIDFSVVKERLCMWLEDNWDHKFLAWEEDRLIGGLLDLLCVDENGGEPYRVGKLDDEIFRQSIVFLPFNPTAENLAQHLVEVIGPLQLLGTGVQLVEVTIEETYKCHVSHSIF